MRIFTLLFFFICILLSPLYSSVRYFIDSDESYSLNDTIILDDIVVTGTMPKVNLRNVPMSISVVSGNKITQRLQPSLLPLLAEEVPGLFISQRGVMGYGVAAGAAGGMSIRGIGGSPTSGVLVLIDGHPQYMGLMGHPLADSYQSMMTERVEVVRGPASVLYGSNAMGGVINIITRKQESDGSHKSAQFSYGSYNTLSAELSGGFRKSQFYTNGSLSYNHSDGHRENMDFEQFNGYIKAGYDFTDNWNSFIDVNLSKSLSSNPGTVTSPIIDNDADILRGVASASLENNYDNTSGAVKLFYNFGTHNINDGYNDYSSFIPDYRFRSNDQMFGASAYQSFSFFEGNKTTAGIDLQRFGGEAITKFPNEPARDSTQVDIHLNNVAVYLNVQQTVMDERLTFNAGIRLDHHELNGSEWVPQLGLSFTPTSYTSIKGILSKGFRNPTIRELYMFPPRNADLKAERLMNYEISLLQMLPEIGISLGINLFYIKGDNIIQTQIVEGRPLNVNSGEVENRGFELTANYNISEELGLSANYSLLDMTYKIIGAPEHKFYVNANYNIGNWEISSGVQYLGNLYTAVRPEPVTENVWLWNARVNYKALEWLNIFVRGENLLGEKYEINIGYPMPGATVFAGIGIDL
ncbi:MAG: TonB-dependent receptor [Fermentimonas caenicola]|jgi:iron complex outermembrane receptor protein|uniref:TonB-dependent receptor n=1 Tax=Lascolabacillus sp. TaxID=1924068 RepID=UPI0011FAEF21|nr:TonB-dependent receptor [Lascolabacillus sp.]MBP6175837.1 TonB-dependent receptor [Fermentimonas sp.]MDI9626767.1 TonB-dependent receptor [Bacteroidota bacterium]TAH60615.1 MAG: TonB-dependent receptor [Fermentimonas caenicola]MBP7104563.1 TonB-dependent receptor [Fermentimonas sp.]MDD4758886.1 TonB-dependent receptor [Lascolabacillus sp.]